MVFDDLNSPLSPPDFPYALVSAIFGSFVLEAYDERFGGQVEKVVRGVEMVYASWSLALTIFETKFFLKEQSFLGPPRSLARQLGEGEEEEGLKGSSAWKKPFSSVNAYANFFPLLHFNPTVKPEIIIFWTNGDLLVKNLVDSQ